MGIIENIRNKPQETRVRIIWVTCAVVVVILLVAWVLVGRMEISSNDSFIGQVLHRIGHPSQTFPGLFNR